MIALASEERAELEQLAESWRGLAVLCVGDVMLDRFTYGSVSRVSPEAPVPVLHIQHQTTMPGGAGNVARNLAELGAHVALVGVRGADEPGYEMERLFAGWPSSTTRLVEDASRATTTKTRFIAGAQQMLRADGEDVRALSSDICAKVIDAVQDMAHGCRAVVAADYGKGVLMTAQVTQALIAAAHGNRAPCIVDSKLSDLSAYAGADVLKPNRGELAAASGLPVFDIEQAAAAAKALRLQAKVGAVVATLGGEGMLVADEAGVVHVPGYKRDVFDVSGAGDTVDAVLALALAAGAPLARAALLANRAASLVVGKAGTATVTTAEILQDLRAQDVRGREDKILSWEQAAAQAAQWRQQGLKVGFTNGVFDLLHPGHVSLIGQARAACDRLFIGLNSDASTRRLKGPTRPVQNELSRALVLASMRDVDRVVIFEQDTPFEIIRLLRPDVLVKGSDYTIDKVVGADIVQGWGGQVILADLKQGQSTTSMIARAKANTSGSP